MRARPLAIAAFAIASAALAAGFFWLQPALAQPLWYHQFADQRCLLGVPHALNVVSNLPFLLVGLAGLRFMAGAALRRPGVFVDPRERWAFWVYFAGLALTGVGSAYYHADPTNARLVWDRMPLTLAFMGLFDSVVAERFSVRLALWLLVPLMLLGVGSVVYWDWTESHGVGDLRPYLVVQFYPLLALPLLLWLFPARYTGTPELWGALAAYALAKGLEALDSQVYTACGAVSGHTLKHLVAGFGSWLILFMLRRRRPMPMLRETPAAVP